jgi:hypothetical protein
LLSVSANPPEVHFLAAVALIATSTKNSQGFTMASTSKTKPEVKLLTIQISSVTPSSPQGVCAEGAYIVTDGKVTLTDREGKPVRDPNGKPYSQPLKEGENPRVIAGRLTKRFRSVLRGKPGVSGFSSPINYPRIVVA